MKIHLLIGHSLLQFPRRIEPQWKQFCRAWYKREILRTGWQAADLGANDPTTPSLAGPGGEAIRQREFWQMPYDENHQMLAGPWQVQINTDGQRYELYVPSPTFEREFLALLRRNSIESQYLDPTAVRCFTPDGPPPGIFEWISHSTFANPSCDLGGREAFQIPPHSSEQRLIITRRLLQLQHTPMPPQLRLATDLWASDPQNT